MTFKCLGLFCKTLTFLGSADQMVIFCRLAGCWYCALTVYCSIGQRKITSNTTIKIQNHVAQSFSLTIFQYQFSFGHNNGDHQTYLNGRKYCGGLHNGTIKATLRLR